MKEPTLAPVYATLYPGLCDIARKHGYALALHGTLTKDLDLIAIPWTEEAVEDEVLAKALKDHVGACLLHEKLCRDLPQLPIVDGPWGNTQVLVNNSVILTFQDPDYKAPKGNGPGYLHAKMVACMSGELNQRLRQGPISLQRVVGTLRRHDGTLIPAVQLAAIRGQQGLTGQGYVEWLDAEWAVRPATITRDGRDPTPKPHGRKAWQLHLDNGASIDLSVMPRTSAGAAP